jgi:hypothetical protein
LILCACDSKINRQEQRWGIGEPQDDYGRVIGFSILKVTAVQPAPLEVTFDRCCPDGQQHDSGNTSGSAQP